MIMSSNRISYRYSRPPIAGFTDSPCHQQILSKIIRGISGQGDIKTRLEQKHMIYGNMRIGQNKDKSSAAINRVGL